MINILASEKYLYLKNLLLQKNLSFNDITLEATRFPDGERYFRILNAECISGKPAVFICGTINDESILEAYHVSCSLVRESCSSLHLVLPYFGYSTMERAVKSGEIVSAKNIARLFSSIPLSAQGNYIYMMDLHSLGTQYYFEQNMHPVHLTSTAVIDHIIADISKNSRQIVLASADMGRAKWIEKMSLRLGIEGAYIMKKRLSGSETAVEALNADVNGKDVLIFDDMIRSGNSIIGAAQAYKSIGARNIFVVCVHGVFVNDAFQKLKQCGIIKSVYCTNTHAVTQSFSDDFLKVYDISDVILTGLKC